MRAHACALVRSQKYMTTTRSHLLLASCPISDPRQLPLLFETRVSEQCLAAEEVHAIAACDGQILAGLAQRLYVRGWMHE